MSHLSLSVNDMHVFKVMNTLLVIEGVTCLWSIPNDAFNNKREWGMLYVLGANIMDAWCVHCYQVTFVGLEFRECRPRLKSIPTPDTHGRVSALGVWS